MNISLTEEKIIFKPSEETWQDSYVLLKITTHLTACTIPGAENLLLKKILFWFSIPLRTWHVLVKQ